MSKSIERLYKRLIKNAGIPIGFIRPEYIEQRLEAYAGLYDIEGFREDIQEMVEGRYGKGIAELKKEEAENLLSYMGELQRLVTAEMKDTEGYKRLQEDTEYVEKSREVSLKRTDIYKEKNIGKKYLSIDIREANFTVLKRYDEEIVKGARNYKELISQYTFYKHLIESKYLRQIIFGNMNPKRQQMLQKIYLNEEKEKLKGVGVIEEDIVQFTPDELVIEITDKGEEEIGEIYNALSKAKLPLRVEEFTLKGLRDRTKEKTIGYIVENTEGKRKARCVTRDDMIYVVRFMTGKQIEEEDTYIEVEGRLAKVLEIPDIEIIG